MYSDLDQVDHTCISSSGSVLCRMRVNATMFSPPGICCASLYVPYIILLWKLTYGEPFDVQRV